MNSLPCAVSIDLRNYLTEKERQDAKEIAAEKRLDELYEQTVAETLGDIEIASIDNTRTANDRATLRGILSQIEDLLAEASHYVI